LRRPTVECLPVMTTQPLPIDTPGLMACIADLDAMTV